MSLQCHSIATSSFRINSNKPVLGIGLGITLLEKYNTYSQISLESLSQTLGPTDLVPEGVQTDAYGTWLPCALVDVLILYVVWVKHVTIQMI